MINLYNFCSDPTNLPADNAFAAIASLGNTRRAFASAEPLIALNGRVSHEYAIQYKKIRFPEGEPAMLRDCAPIELEQYCVMCLQQPWPAAEAKIATDAEASYMYAKQVLHQRFPQGEPVISSAPYQWTHHYQRYFNCILA